MVDFTAFFSKETKSFKVLDLKYDQAGSKEAFCHAFWFKNLLVIARIELSLSNILTNMYFTKVKTLSNLRYFDFAHDERVRALKFLYTFSKVMEFSDVSDPRITATRWPSG